MNLNTKAKSHNERRWEFFKAVLESWLQQGVSDARALGFIYYELWAALHERDQWSNPIPKFNCRWDLYFECTRCGCQTSGFHGTWLSGRDRTGLFRCFTCMNLDLAEPTGRYMMFCLLNQATGIDLTSHVVPYPFSDTPSPNHESDVTSERGQ